MSEKRCSERVYGGSFMGHSCRKTATREEDGRPWCAQHAPSAVKARRDARTLRWNAENRQREYHAESRRLRDVLLNVVLTTTSDLPPEVQAAREAVRQHEASTP